MLIFILSPSNKNISICLCYF